MRSKMLNKKNMFCYYQKFFFFIFLQSLVYNNNTFHEHFYVKHC